MLSSVEIKNLNQASTAAVASEKTTGCPAELTVCQWAQESGWGMHVPGNSNNPFGIKAKLEEPFIAVMTPEHLHGTDTRMIQNFRVFPTLKDAFDYHGSLIATGAPYGKAFEEYERTKDIVQLIKGIAPHYATDPNYAKELLAFLTMPMVTNAIAEARKS